MTKKAKTQTITVKTNLENPEPVELIAQSVIDVSDAFKRIAQNGLQKRAIILLIHDIVKNKGVNMTQIEAVLDAAPKLESYYIKQLPKGGK